MRKIFIVAFLMASLFTVEAQVKTPQSSPVGKIEQVVGLTEVKIEYSRPSIKGRTVYGELVPFGKRWRTGANANTTVSFSDDVVINGKTLKEGKYALFTVPRADNWDVIFYKDVNNWGLPQEWDDTKVALQVTIKPQVISNSVETLTMDVGNITNDGASLDLLWERTKISVPFSVPTKEMAMESITKTLAGPSQGDYYSAAQYYFQSEQDLNQALTWVNTAISLTPKGQDAPFWYYRLKSLIQAKLGDKKGAIETAKISLSGATKAGNAHPKSC